MARSKRSRGIPKLEPAVLTFDFAGTQVPPNGVIADTVDLSQVASLVNRRFYRQGLNWAVAGFKILSTAQTGSASVQKLPNTWVMSNAWHKSYAAWTRMNNEALEEAESVRPRFLDFKVFADTHHHTNGFAGNLLPRSSDAVVATAGEWESSKFVVPDTTSATGGINNFEAIVVGASYPGLGASGLNAVSLIEGYAASRGLPNVVDPNTPDDARDSDGATPENFLSALFNEGTQQDSEVLADMTAENNLAPYPFENDGVNIDTMYPGGANQLASLELHDTEFISATTIGGTTRLKGGNFPCGLVRLVLTNTSESSPMAWTLQVSLVPGNHRGYLAEPMQDM